MRRKSYGPSLMQYRDTYNPFGAFISPELMATAAHEAAHAVVGAALGYRVTGAEIEHKDHTIYSWRGRCWTAGAVDGDQTDQLTASAVLTVAPLVGRERLEGIVRFQEPETLFPSDAKSFGITVDALGEDYRSFRAACLRTAGELLDTHAASWRSVTYNLIRLDNLDENDLRTINPALFSLWEQHQEVVPEIPMSVPSRTPAPPRRTTGRTMRDIVPGLRYGDAIPIEVR